MEPSPKHKQGYRLLLVTGIPCWSTPSGYITPDLWVRDLEAQVSVVDELCIASPEAATVRGRMAPLPSAIRVVLYKDLKSSSDVRHLVQQYDVVQVGCNVPVWTRVGRMYVRVARAARELGKCVICSVSSNRARTTLLNAEHRSLPSRLRARIRSASIVHAQKRIMGLADGVCLVGHGLVDLVPKRVRETKQIYVGTASWIKHDEVIDEQQFAKRMADLKHISSLRLCIASRLEPMKGVHLGIEALHVLQEKNTHRGVELDILGAGAELDRLRQLARGHGLDSCVTFRGTFSYPTSFFSEISKCHVMVLTNLNDEQPRIVFDALAQGLVVVCPDTLPYRSLGIDNEVLYRCGDAHALAQVIERLRDPAFLTGALLRMRKLVLENTVDAMHAGRARWISGLLARD